VLHHVPTQIPKEAATLELRSEDGTLMEQRVADVPGVSRRTTRPVARHWEHPGVLGHMAFPCAWGSREPGGVSVSRLELSAPAALAEGNSRLRGCKKPI
jgi:hypothetical protein